jgi:CRP-like cAMP-binding protein
MAAQARAAADRAEANLDAMAVRALTRRVATADEELHTAQAKGASAVCRAVAELWQMEARWRHLGLLKDLAATELMAELKDNPPLPGMSPLGTKGTMAAEVAKQQSSRCGKLLAYLPEATREAAARTAQQGRRMSMRNSRRFSIRGSGAMLLDAKPAESEEQMEKRDTLTQIPLLAGTSEDTIESLLPLMDTIDIDTAGFELIKEGAVPSHFYVLVEGDVEIVLKSGIRVAKLSGQHKNAASSYPFFGEIGMLMNAAAMAAAKTSCACTLLGVSRANFPAFLGLVPDLTQRMTVIGDLRAKQSKVLQHNRQVEDEDSSSSEEESDDGDDSTGNESDGYRMEESKELAALRPIYQSLDVDNLGAVDEWELWKFLQKAAKKTKSGVEDVMSFEDMQRGMALVDEDGNGTIDWEEFTALMLGKVAGAETLAAAMRTAYAVGTKGDWDGTGSFRCTQRRSGIGSRRKQSRRESVSMSLLPGSSERPIEDTLLPVLRHVLREQLPDDVAAVVRVIAPGGSRVQLNASAPTGNQACSYDHTYYATIEHYVSARPKVSLKLSVPGHVR